MKLHKRLHTGVPGNSIGYSASRLSKLLKRKAVPAPRKAKPKIHTQRCNSCHAMCLPEPKFHQIRFVPNRGFVCYDCVPNHKVRHAAYKAATA